MGAVFHFLVEPYFASKNHILIFFIFVDFLAQREELFTSISLLIIKSLFIFRVEFHMLTFNCHLLYCVRRRLNEIH